MVFFLLGLVVLAAGLFLIGVPVKVIGGSYLCVFGVFLVFIAIAAIVSANTNSSPSKEG
jgi:hypothetical protein